METTLTDRVLGDRYRLGEVLGRGGMADVYDAVDLRLGRPVAVKVLRADMAVRSDVRRRFEDEARAAASLSHPNVVSVYDTGDDDGTPWIVMERLSGKTLANRLVDGPSEPAFAASVAGDVLGALGAAHRAGILHRDVKPGNILFDDHGCAKVADFGIAKSIEAVGNDHTTAGLLLGTPRYLAPERIDGKPATPSSDLYSLGVVLYEALSGHKAFGGTTAVEVAYQVQHAEVPPLASARPGLPPALVAVVERAMARDPRQRFRSADEMLAALQPALTAAAGAPVVAPDDTMADHTLIETRPPGPARDRRTLLLAGAVALFVVLLVFLLVTTSGKSNGTGKPATALGASTTAAPTTTTAPPTTTTANPVASQLSALAGRVRDNSGDAGPEAADRLQGIADTLRAGRNAGPDATALAGDVVGWAQDGTLSATAARDILGALRQVPGVDLSAVTVVTRGSGRGNGKGQGQGSGD